MFLVHKITGEFEQVFQTSDKLFFYKKNAEEYIEQRKAEMKKYLVKVNVFYYIRQIEIEDEDEMKWRE
jgi:hypothetical protein